MNPIDRLGPLTSTGEAKAPAPKSGTGFRDLVASQVTFSRHASQRMQERHIALTPNDMNLLQEAIGQARTAGAKQAAIVMEPGIFIVAPHSNTVITTVAKNTNQPMQLISQVDALVLVGGTSSEGASSPRPTDGGQPALVHWSLLQNTDQ